MAALGGRIEQSAGSVFNVADPEIHSMRKIVSAIAGATGARLRIISLPSPILKPAALGGDLLARLLGRANANVVLGGAGPFA